MQNTSSKQEQEFLSLFSIDSFKLDLNKRIALEIIKRGRIEEKYSQGLIAPETVLDFFRDFQPDRRDIYASRVISEGEFQEITGTHGKAAIQNSLPKNSQLNREIEQKKKILKSYLTELPVQMRLYPNTWKKEIRELAIEMFGRSECALINLCNHSFTLKDSRYLKRAYNLYVESDEDCAVEYLIDLRFRLNKVADILDRFREKYEKFTGESSKIITSKLEQQVEEFLKQTHVPFRRQFPYREITQERSMRRCFADFLVGNTVIEVADEEDNFIHTPAYFAKLADKTLVTAEANKNFLVISSSDKDSYSKLKAVISTAVTPQQPLDFQDILESREELAAVLVENSDTQARARKHPTRNAHFASNLYMMGYLRAREN